MHLQTFSIFPHGYKTLYLKSNIASYLFIFDKRLGPHPILETVNSSYCGDHYAVVRSGEEVLKRGLNNTTVLLLRLAKRFS